MFQIAPYSAKDEVKHQWVCAIEKHQKVDFYHCQILVCELHFDAKLITKRKDRNILDKQAVPTIFPCDEQLKTIAHEYEFFCLHLNIIFFMSFSSFRPIICLKFSLHFQAHQSQSLKTNHLKT